MLIEEPSTTRRPRLLRSPLPLALLGLAGCTSMLIGLIEETPAPAAITAAFPSTGVLRAASLFTDQRLVFLMLLGGFLLMAIGCFALSRRSFRDALKAEAQRRR